MSLRILFKTMVALIVVTVLFFILMNSRVPSFVTSSKFFRHLSRQDILQSNEGGDAIDASSSSTRRMADDHGEMRSYEHSNVLTPRFQRTGLKMTTPLLPTIHLAVVTCGDRTPEAVTMLKSAAALTTHAVLVFHIFAERKLQELISKELQAWPGQYSDKMEFRVYDVTFPPQQNATWWTRIFWRPCAYQRLFLHSLLTDIDAVIYVDTDTLFLSSLLPVWHTFSRFNSRQLMGLAANHENPRGGGWYKQVSKIPYIHPSGVNSGVILMNLTRLRNSDWSQCILRYSHDYRSKLRLVDQDIFNIYLHFHPEALLWLDCALNYRTDHCLFRYKDPSSACKSAETGGVHILHGNRRAFHTYGTLRDVYDAFNQFRLGEAVRTGLLYKVRSSLRKTTTTCSTVARAFFRRLSDTVAEMERSA